MKLTITILTLLFSISAFAGMVHCTGETYPTIEYSDYSGEIVVKDAAGNVVLDHEDGYQMKETFLETFPGQTKYEIFHHEEPEVIELSFTIVDGKDLGWGHISTYYYNVLDELVEIDEKVVCEIIR